MSFSGPSYSIDAELGDLLKTVSSEGAAATNYALETGGNLAAVSASTTTVAANTGATATSAASIATNTATVATNTGTVATNTGAMATSTASIAANTGRIPAQGLAGPANSLPVVLCSDVAMTGPAAQTAGNNILTTDGSAT
ncbi:MAG: hypothetical protein ACK5UT_01055, partial [Acidobacteriota bacterium]